MQTTAAQSEPLGSEKVGVLLRKYAIPSVISLIINSLYNIVDQIFIGHGVGYLGNRRDQHHRAHRHHRHCPCPGCWGMVWQPYTASVWVRKEPKKAAQAVGSMVVVASVVRDCVRRFLRSF